MFNTTTSPNWNYTDLGPNKWADICPAFNQANRFQYQSPINIPIDFLTKQHQSVVSSASTSQLALNYFEDTFKPVIFNHSLHLLPTSHEQTITFNEITYRLDDIHIHLPSEHVLDNQTFPLEIHLVHRNSFGQAAVIAVFVQPDTQSVAPFEKINTVFKLDATTLLPNLEHYFSYIGSLTTPPTKGPINWIILPTPKMLNVPWLRTFKQLVPIANNRPIQPSHGRPIIYHKN